MLNTIRYLRALDMPLTEIEDFLKNKDIDCIEEKLRQQKQAVLKKQQELKRIEQKIDGSADMEVPIRKLDQSGAEAVVFLGKVGLGISVEHLQKAETDRYDGIFLILDQEDIYTGETLGLPETLCVRLRFRGSYAEAPAQYQKLLDYIDKHKMQIVGFSREITLIDYGITNDTEKFVTEICIPVKPVRYHADTAPSSAF